MFKKCKLFVFMDVHSTRQSVHSCGTPCLAGSWVPQKPALKSTARVTGKPLVCGGKDAQPGWAMASLSSRSTTLIQTENKTYRTHPVSCVQCSGTDHPLCFALLTLKKASGCYHGPPHPPETCGSRLAHAGGSLQGSWERPQVLAIHWSLGK